MEEKDLSKIFKVTELIEVSPLLFVNRIKVLKHTFNVFLISTL